MANFFISVKLHVGILTCLAFGLSPGILHAQPYSIFGPSEIDLSACSPNGPTGTVSVTFWVIRGSKITGPTDVQFNNLPPDVHVVVSPAKLTYPGFVTGEQVTATFTPTTGVDFQDQVIEIRAFDLSFQAKNQIILHGTCPRQNKDFTIRGSFFSNNVGVIFPVDSAIVEIYRDVRLGFDQHAS